MPTLVERLWEGGGYGPRRDRTPFRYNAYVPDPIAELDPELPGATTEIVAQATAEVARLNADAGGVDLEALAGPLLRAEALGSSHIEGLRVSNKRLAIAAYEPASGDATATAIIGNVKAMEQAVAIGAAGRALTTDDLLTIHRTLLEGTTEARYGGRVRDEQNWIGGRPTSPWEADFIPPPETEVERLLADLVRFCNRDDLPAVVQAGIAHAQFETIHPFADGNGRAGRCLIHVVLRRRNLAPSFVPPVSVVLATNAKAYIGGLTDFREGRLADWCGVFAQAVRSSATAAEELARRIDALREKLLATAGEPRRGSAARRIIEGLPQYPVLSADTVAAAYGTAANSARRALNELQERGVLTPTRVGRRRGREWVCEPLFDLLDDFEFGLASPFSESQPRRQAPTRHLRNASRPKS